MSAEAKIFELQRDKNDLECWQQVDSKPGHWNAKTALTHYLLEEEPPEGTYRCEAGGGHATVSWDGNRATA